jgi:lantibiotic leader peptide-processing serine protease
LHNSHHRSYESPVSLIAKGGKMKRFITLLSLVTLILIFVPSTPVTATESESIRWVINYNGSSIPGSALANIEAAGGQLVRTLPQVGIAVAVSDNPNFASTMKGMARVHSVGEVPAMSVPEVAVVPLELTPDTVPDPPAALWDLLWGIARVNAPAAWDAGITGSHDTVVAVIDTGIASNHPDVGPNLVFNACIVSTGDHTTGACTPYPSLSFHGTHVAGTVAANFGGGVVGVGPDLGLANYNVFELFPDGSVRAFFDSVWAAMIDAADQDFDVINMSLGAIGDFRGPDGSAPFFMATQRVANYVNQQGTFIVASAGNANLDLNGPLFNLPGGAPGIANIGATGIRPDPVFPQPDAFDVRAFYSNFGAAVTLVAPGGDCGLPDSCDPATRPANWFEYLVLSAFVAPNPACAATESCPIGWAWAGGTSMAAPHVSGVAGLMRDQNPNLSPNQMEAILKQTAERLGDRQQFGHGMVNAHAAATGP